MSNFLTGIAPSIALTRKIARFSWGSKCEKAFRTVKQNLIDAPVFCYPILIWYFFFSVMQLMTVLVLFYPKYRMERNALFAISGDLSITLKDIIVPQRKNAQVPQRKNAQQFFFLLRSLDLTFTVITELKMANYLKKKSKSWSRSCWCQ